MLGRRAARFDSCDSLRAGIIGSAGYGTHLRSSVATREDRRVDWTVGATLAVTAVLAFAGYLATYWTNRRLAERAARLERVNLQLRDFYGPLLALVSASTRSWEVFRDHYKPGRGSFWRSGPPPTAEQAEAWRTWIRQVFMPLDEQMERLVLTKADLLNEDGNEEGSKEGMDSRLLDLVAHVQSYRVQIAKWDSGDLREPKALINFPKGLKQYATDGYAKLKAEQQELLRRRWR